MNRWIKWYNLDCFYAADAICEVDILLESAAIASVVLMIVFFVLFIFICSKKNVIFAAMILL